MSAKPIFLIRFLKSYGVNNRDELLKLIDKIKEKIGDDYYVLAIDSQFDVSVLNGDIIEIDEEKINEWFKR